MEIIKQGEHVSGATYALGFILEDDPGSGFSFDCDEDGNILPIEHQAGRDSYAMCLRGQDADGRRILPEGVKTYPFSYYDPPVGKCRCGRKLTLADFTNTCECGADYNFAGQALAPRSCWGEETGEHWSECY